jgi:serine/threonine-protein kinase
MAIVALAEDTLLGREVALKRMTTVGDPHGGLRLRREALIGASISHPNLVSVYDVFDGQDGNVVIVMEYVDGETLARKLDREGALAPAEALQILGGVAAGLDAIHERGIIHRDVKPPNILLGSAGAVKLADLGVASVPDHTRITSSGAVVGSLRYMAPEQVENARMTKAIDVYALATVTFEALSGRKARREANPLALAHAIASRPPPDLREAWPQAPPEAAELLRSAMSRRPAERPASAGELIGRLGEILIPEPTVRMAPVRVTAGPSLAPARDRPAAVPPAAARPTPARRPKPARAALPSAASPPRRSRRGLGAAALLALVVAAAVALVLTASSGGGPAGHSGTGASRLAGRGAAHSKGSGSAGSAAAGSSGSASPSSTASAPVAAVEAFYRQGAAHNYPAAWALADPAFRSQLNSYQDFAAGQQNVRSVSFDSARVVSQSGNAATVAVRTTSTHTDGPHQCAGTVDLARPGSSGGWLLHQIHINCT